MTVSTNPYTSQTISSYNSGPPPDDGTTGADNLVTWDKHKTKLGDPIKALAEDINSQLTTAFAKGINADAGERNQMDSSLAFAWATATIGNSIATPLSSAAYLSGATTDTLFELKTGSVYDGAVLTLKTLSASDNITLLHATATSAATATAANIYLINQLSRALDTQYSPITLVYDSGVASGWVEKNPNLADLVSGSEATATGASVTLSSDIPSGTKRITVQFEGLGIDATDTPIVQIGDSGGLETDNYVSGTGSVGATTGFVVSSLLAADDTHGAMVLTLKDSDNFTWAAHGSVWRDGGTDSAAATAGTKSLSAELTTVAVTILGTASFDAGTINLIHEK